MGDRASNGGGVATDLSAMAKFMTGIRAGFGAMSSAWFGPLDPIPQVVPQDQADSLGVTGRQFDYQTGYNISYQPRNEEPVSFKQLRALADNYDLLRIIIETCKDELQTQEWIIKPKDAKAKPDKRCDDVKAFFQFPDKEHDHGTWLRMLVEDMLVIDAPALYPRMTKGGQLYSLEIMDGSTIKRVIDSTGRTPLPPYPAYQQILKGVPAVDYTRDELLYFPRNPRSFKVYGYSPVEQIIMTVNIALRRQLHQLEWYTEGNTPDLLFGVPSTWQPEQIKQMQLWWDTLINDTASRRKAKFIPGDAKPYDTKEKALKDEFDEWLARVVCFCFSRSPQPFIKEVNRATAQTSKEASKEEGKGPRMLWIKRLHDFIIAKYFGFTDIEFSWEDQTSVDPKVQAEIDQIYLTNYVISPAEVRARIGLEGSAPEKPAMPVTTPDDDPEKKPDGEPPVTAESDSIEKVACGCDVLRKKKRMKAIDRNRQSIVKARNSAQKVLTAFFKSAAKNVAEHLSEIMGTERVERADKSEVDAILEQLDLEALNWATLAEPMAKAIESAHNSGSVVALNQIGVIATESITSLLNERSAAFAADRGAELVGMKWVGTELIPNPDAKWQITETTRDMLRTTVSSAIDEGWSTGKLANEIESSTAFSESRAEMIARTEIARADVDGNMTAYRESGVVTGKEWIVGSEHDDDDECTENEAAGVIGLDEYFPSGDDAAPAHPNCICDILPVLMEKEGDDNG